MDIQGPSDSLRVDYSRVNQYVGSELEKPSFWQSVKKGFAKFGSFLGTATGVVGPLFGPLGMIAAAAGYGVKNVSNRALEKMANREQFNHAFLHQRIIAVGLVLGKIAQSEPVE